MVSKLVEAEELDRTSRSLSLLVWHGPRADTCSMLNHSPRCRRFIRAGREMSQFYRSVSLAASEQTWSKLQLCR